MVDNPFTTCSVIQTSDGYYVSSNCWRIGPMSEKGAHETCVLLRAAYAAGQEDLRGQINALLSPPAKDGAAIF